jgi:hypothetical protein
MMVLKEGQTAPGSGSHFQVLAAQRKDRDG